MVKGRLRKMKKVKESEKKSAGKAKASIIRVATNDDAEFEEFVIRIPKVRSSAMVCQALRASLRTFQTIIEAISGK